MALLSLSERTEFLSENPGWEIEGETLKKSFGFKDFAAATGFVVQVAMLAEKVFHHPAIDIRWNRVTIASSTHDHGGLTEKDTDLAARIEGLIAES